MFYTSSIIALPDIHDTTSNYIKNKVYCINERMIDMQALYDSKSKDIDSRGIPLLLSDHNKYETWIIVELALGK